MVSAYLERELKYDVEPAFALPSFAELLPDGAAVEHEVVELRSDYYDTADQALLRATLTLRRRTGATDTGWQLKAPQGSFREEIGSELGDPGEDVPEELRRLLLGVTRGRPLVQLATVSTQRSITRLLAADGRRLAEIDDDTVHATSLDRAAADGSGGAAAYSTTWREVEVELGDDELEVLYALGKRLRQAGARRSRSASKLARALPPAGADGAAGGKAHSKPRAGDVLVSYLRAQQTAILAGDLALRRGDAAVIHRTRVATRRLRSTLRVFAGFVDAERAEALDGELRWFAEALGTVRDTQVLRSRLGALVDDLDATLLLGPVRERVDTELGREHEQRWQALVELLDSARYLTMLADIDAWARRPPLTGQASRPARVLARSVARADAEVARKLRRANKTGDVGRLHAARKSAKRARYAAEAAEAVLGAKAAATNAARYQRLQDLLGEHQDSVVSQDLLRRLAVVAGESPGENGFAFGVLHERESARARAARRRARTVARRYA